MPRSRASLFLALAAFASFACAALADAPLGTSRLAARVAEDTVAFEGAAYDGCCDDANAADLLDCCRTGGCCPTASGSAGADGAPAFLSCCATKRGTRASNAARSRVTSLGPSYDGCCTPSSDGAPLMDCCAAGGCCPTAAGASLSCCAATSATKKSAIPGTPSRSRGSLRRAGALPRLGTSRPSVAQPVDPEIAFVPAEEASADDPVYGRFARAEPGGEGYYAAAAAAEGQAESDADAADPDALRVVAQTANDDTADPVDPMDDAVRVKYVVDMHAEKPVAGSSEDHSPEKVRERREAAHEARGAEWWVRRERKRERWRSAALQVAAVACLVVWLTALVVSWVLKRADGRSEDEQSAADREKEPLLAA